MTGYSIPDGAFNVNEEGTFASHHLNRANKASMALYDIILTWNAYHPDPYEAFSELIRETRQRMLKYRLRKLFEIGINKDEKSVQEENWITKEDFRAIFPDNLEFEVDLKNQRYKGSLFYLWDEVFTKIPFQEKLDIINSKITRFRKALKESKNPYMEFLKDYPSVESRFLDDAITFAKAFCRLGAERIVDRGAGELAYIWHIYLMRQAFDLE